jgi:hypothetical protein
MKTIHLIYIFIILLLAMPASAQELELTNGVYEKKEVVEVSGAPILTLYERAIEALSDWVGPDGRSSIGIDYSEKETGTVIYKGKFYLGFKNIFLGSGADRFTNFTLKVKCKDERAQVTVTVQSFICKFTNGVTTDYSLSQLVDAVKKAKGKKRERGVAMVEEIKESVDILIDAIKQRLSASSDDDF